MMKPCIESRLVQNLARIAGKNPQEFQAFRLESGAVRVVGPASAVSYQGEAWVSKFVSHLHRGYFTPPVIHARSVVAATAEGGTG